MDIYVARQPIFDTKNKVFAYELLYRTNEQNFFDQSVNSDVATSLLLMNSYYTFGIDKLVGDGKAFINFDKNLIDSEIPMLLDKEKIVVELLEDIIPDANFVSKVKNLKANGYTIAIDDYVEGYKFEELVHLSDIIKVDFFGNTPEQIAKIVKIWKPRGKILLAEKVETQEVFEWAKGIGFDLFQGYYFSKPSMIKGRNIENSAFQYVRIMKELNVKEPNYKNIASIIETDVNLTYKLFKLVNMNFTASKKITSIQHALSILGINSFEKWVSLAMVQNLAGNKPQELIKISMTRAKFMELIGLNSKLKSVANEMMLVGILSVIDALLEKPIDEIMMELPLGEDIKNALILLPGKYTLSYELVLDFEKGDFAEEEDWMKAIGLDYAEIHKYYYEAIEWAENLYSAMNE